MKPGDLIRFYLDNNHDYVGLVIKTIGDFDVIVHTVSGIHRWPLDNCELVSESG